MSRQTKGEKRLTWKEKRILKKLNKETAEKLVQKVGKKKSSVGKFLKCATICTTVTVGLVALIYCLRPALAEGEQIYIYLDNGLSKYDTIMYSIDGGNTFNEMKPLSDGVNADKLASLESSENVNPQYVYVSNEKVTAGETSVIFKGIASGIVYDTVTNYRNDGTREWGYNYENFVWTSDAITVYDQNNCYYAPPQLMEYKYGGYAATVSGGVKNYTTFIYAYGDKADNGTTGIAQPGNTNAMLEPNSGLNRTFYDGQYLMKGKAGHINSKNDLGNLSQSISALTGTGTTYEGSFDALGDGNNGITFGTKVYSAKADFFDYYSDWELSGEILENLKSVYDAAIKRFNFEEESMTLGLFGNATLTENPDDPSDTVLYVQDDGSDSYASIDMSELAGMDFTNGFSISMNVRPTVNSTDWNYLFGIGTFGTPGVKDWSYFDGSIGFILRKDKIGGAYMAYVPVDGWVEGNKLGASADNNLYDYLITTGADKWHHLTYVYGKNQVSVYLDGVLTVRHEATEMDSILAGLSSGDTFNIGAGIDPVVNNFGGYIDDVVVYATELSKYDVQQISQNTQIAENHTSQTVKKEPVIQYGFDYTNNMTFTDDTTGYVTEADGNKVFYMKGDGIDIKAGYISIDIEDVLKKYDFTNGLTVSMNIKPSACSAELDEWRYIFGIGKNGYTADEGDVETWTYVDGSIGFYVRESLTNTPHLYANEGWINGNDVNGNFDYFKAGKDQWHKLTYVYGSSEIAVYLDGVKIKSNTPVQALETASILSSLSNGDTFNIGAGIDNRYGRYAGYIDDVMIYNEALSESEVSAIPEKAKEEAEADVSFGFDLNAAIRAFRNNVFTKLSDVLVKNPDDASDNVLYFEPGEEANTGTHISISTETINHIDFSDGFTISMNVKPVGKGSTDAVNILENGTYNWTEVNYLYGFGINGYTPEDDVEVWKYVDGSLSLTSRADAGNNFYREYKWGESNEEYQYFYSGGTGNCNDWYKLTYVYTKDSFAVYRNDILVGRQDADNMEEVLMMLNTASTLNIGAGIDTRLDSYGGYVDDVRIYGKALTATQVAAISDKVVDDVENELLQYEKFGSFSQSTNRVSYTYQGLHWNAAISKYYENISLGRSLSCALYFGSNSWMPGNNRYYLYDRNGNALFTPEQVEAANNGAGTVFVTAGKDGSLTESSDNAILQPADRQYLKTLWGFSSDIANIMHGQSNSRGVEDLVELIPITESGITSKVPALMGTGVETPYFNKEFIEGDNDANAVYGKVYEDVDFDFIYNEETGYFEYDSTKYYHATRLTQNKYTGEYYMRYTNEGVTKADASEEDKNGSSTTANQYYPFNSIATNAAFSTENLMFGMNLNIPFSMYVDKEDREKNIFKFSGDDDVWVYVDGIEVIDIGGTHAAVGGILDLKNEFSLISSVYNEKTGKADSSFNIVKSGTDASVSATEKAAFAIVSANGIDPALVNTEISISEANFFDDIYRPKKGDSITYTYNIVTDGETGEKLLQVHYMNAVSYDKETSATTDIEGGNEGYAVFSLKDIDIPDNAQAGEDVSDHEISVYYMERGLNSSNLKLAFNFVASTEKEIEKTWNDGEEDVTDTDYIEVELYRAEPTTLADQLYTLNGVTMDAPNSQPQDFLFIKSLAYQSNGTTKPRYTFASENDIVSLQYKPQDEGGVDGAVIFSINGVELTREFYEQLKELMDMKIYVNNEEIDSSAFISVLDEGGNPTEYKYIQMPESIDRNMIRIEFAAKTEVISGDPAVDKLYDTLNILNTNGWLIEVHAVSLETETEATTDGEGNIITPAVKSEIEHIGIPEERLNSPTEVNTIIVKGDGYIPDRIIDGADMEFHIVTDQEEVVVSVDTYYRNDLMVIAYVSGDEVRTEDSKLVSLWDPVVYGNVELVEDASKRLDKDSDWKAVWSNLAEGVEINGVVYPYNYFVREATVVKSSHTNEAEDYNASYYDENGNEITPQLMTIINDQGEEEQINVYSVDEKSYITLINTPATDIKVSKVWSTTAERKDSVVINIYKVVEGKLLNGDVYAQYVTNVNLTEAELEGKNETKETWSYTIQNLPLYETVDGESKLITYYALEEQFGEEYIVNYSSVGVELKDELGNTATYYPLTATADKSLNTITVTNRPNNSGLYDLKVYKTGEQTGKPALSGAVFKLEKYISGDYETGVYEVVNDGQGNETFTTGLDGYVLFSGLEGGATYRLTEVVAPTGYVRDETPIIFTVSSDEDKNLSYSDGNILNNNSLVSGVWDENNDTLTYTIENPILSVILPDTGGGIVGLMIVGFMLVMISTTVVVIRKEKLL